MDPSRLFNSSLEGKVRRAVDRREGDKINEAALKDFFRAAVAPNLKSKGPSTVKPTLLAGGDPQIAKADGDASRAGLHRGHAGLETQRRRPPRRAHRAQRAEGRAVKLALLWHRRRLRRCTASAPLNTAFDCMDHG
ncbi:MAG TPA: hypothetical protein VIS96_09145 [Terrimicrobiaceae bacterium]